MWWPIYWSSCAFISFLKYSARSFDSLIESLASWTPIATCILLLQKRSLWAWWRFALIQQPVDSNTACSVHCRKELYGFHCIRLCCISAATCSLCPLCLLGILWLLLKAPICCWVRFLVVDSHVSDQGGVLLCTAFFARHIPTCNFNYGNNLYVLVLVIPFC